MAKSAKDVQNREIADLEDAIDKGLVRRDILEQNPLGKAPLKLVTGEQHTRSVSFALQPGAIVAHVGATVIFVCG